MRQLASQTGDKAVRRSETYSFRELRRFSGAEGILSVLIDLWRNGVETTKGSILCTGSLWPHLEKMFSDKKSPLFGRETHRLILRPWTPAGIAKFIDPKLPHLGARLITAHALTGGVAWYLDLLEQKRFLPKLHLQSWQAVCELFIDGPLRNEDSEILNSHLRGDAQTLMHSLLEGKSRRVEFESVLTKTNFIRI